MNAESLGGLRLDEGIGTCGKEGQTVPLKDIRRWQARNRLLLAGKRSTVQMNPYLSFNGQCEAAFKFYQQCLGGQPGAIFRYAGTPLADHVPADWQDKVMHGSLTIGEQVLMGADVAPDRYEQPKGFSLSLHIQSTVDAERIFRDLAKDGRIVLPLEKTFWAALFGMVVDRFGIPWLINCEGQPPEG